VLGSGDKAKKKIIDSTNIFEGLKLNGYSEISSVRVDADDREQKRRIEVERKREELRYKKEIEKEMSDKINEEVNASWEQLLSMQVPQNLLAEIEEQKKTCQEVLQSKDKIIKEYSQEIKQKEEEYTKALDKQNEDIGMETPTRVFFVVLSCVAENIINRMREQLKKLENSVEAECAAVEEAFLEERRALRNKNAAELEALHEERRNKEA
jgi:dynein regulatory complex protein 1